MNFSQAGEQLNMTRDGARKRILKFKNELDSYLEKDESGKIIGISEEGIEELRNVGQSRRSFKQERAQHQYDLLLEKYNGLNKLYEAQVKHNDELSKLLDQMRDENIKLNAELSQYRSAGLLQRLLGFKKS